MSDADDVKAQADELLAHPLLSEDVVVVPAVVLQAMARRRRRVLAAAVAGLLLVVGGLLFITSSNGDRSLDNTDAIRELVTTQRQLQRQLLEERRQRDVLAGQLSSTNVLLGLRIEQLEQLLRGVGQTIPPLTQAKVQELLAAQPGAVTDHPSQQPASSSSTSSPRPSSSPRSSRSPAPRPTRSPGPRPTRSPAPSPPPAVQVCVTNPITGARTCVPA